MIYVFEAFNATELEQPLYYHYDKLSDETLTVFTKRVVNDSILCRQFPTEGVSKSSRKIYLILFSIGFFHLKNSLRSASAKELNALSQDKKINYLTLVRDALEIRTWQSARELSCRLFHFMGLMHGKGGPTCTELQKTIEFYQTCSIPYRQLEPAKFSKRDQLYISLHSLASPGNFLDIDTFNWFIKMSKFGVVNFIREIDLQKDENYLAEDLFALSHSLDPDDYFDLMARLFSLADGVEPVEDKIHLSRYSTIGLWKTLNDLIFAFTPLQPKLKIFKKIIQKMENYLKDHSFSLESLAAFFTISNDKTKSKQANNFSIGLFYAWWFQRPYRTTETIYDRFCELGLYRTIGMNRTILPQNEFGEALFTAFRSKFPDLPYHAVTAENAYIAFKKLKKSA